jgi:hypothetical protein
MERDARLAALYRAAPRDGPPPALDDAIRAAARRAVSSRPRLTSVGFGLRSWGIPLSIAAVVVLSASLVIVMREEAPELTESPRADDSAIALRKAETPSAMAGKSAPAVPRTLVPATRSRDDIASKSAAPAAEPIADFRARSADADSVAKQREGTAANVPSPLAQRAAPEAFPGDASVNETKTAGPAEIKDRSKTESRSSYGIVGGGAQLQAPVSPAPAAAARPDAPAPAAAPPPARTEPQLMRMAGETVADAKLPPEKWLERIEALRKQGKLDEARASLAEFRRRYPDYQLPAALKDGIPP